MLRREDPGEKKYNRDMNLKVLRNFTISAAIVAGGLYVATHWSGWFGNANLEQRVDTTAVQPKISLIQDNFLVSSKNKITHKNNFLYIDGRQYSLDSMKAWNPGYDFGKKPKPGDILHTSGYHLPQGAGDTQVIF